MRKWGKILGAIAVGSLVVGGCQKTDAQLQQAAKAIAKITTPINLSRSCFYVVYPNGKPSDFLDYFFSDLGVVEWPIAVDVAVDEGEAQQMQAAGITILPPEVKLSPTKRQNPQQKELVLLADNGAGNIVVQGYLAKEEKVHLTEGWSLPPATPDEATQQICQSNLEMGIDAGKENN